MNMDHLISIDTALGIAMGILVPLLLWGWKFHGMVKDTKEMHLDPDKYGFGTRTTNTLLQQHMKDEMEQHREYIAATKELKYVIQELSHYVQWMIKAEKGYQAPPYVREPRSPYGGD